MTTRPTTAPPAALKPSAPGVLPGFAISLAAAARDRFWNTPGQLQLALTGIVVSALVFAAAVYWGDAQLRHGIKTVTADTAPSIRAAEEIRADLAELHSEFVNEFLDTAAAAAHRDEVNKKRDAVAQHLMDAARNITFEREKGPILTLLARLQDYQELAGRARERRAAGADPLAEISRADAVLHEALLPAADELNAVNHEYLDRGYDQARWAATGAAGLVSLTGLLLLVALATTQVYISARMRRTLNPPLLAATAATLLTLGWSLAAFGTGMYHLKIATRDAFDSVYSLKVAQALAYDANGDESQWLLDRGRAKQLAAAFLDKSDRILRLPPGQSAADFLSVVKRGVPPQPATTGKLADELRNITFIGEQPAAARAAETWLAYMRIDGDIRRLESEGKHAEAVALCVGKQPGQSDEAFSRFTEALKTTIDINQAAFDRSTAAATAALDPLTVLNPATLIAVIGLSVVGVWPRLREYAV